MSEVAAGNADVAQDEGCGGLPQRSQDLLPPSPFASGQWTGMCRRKAIAGNKRSFSIQVYGGWGGADDHSTSKFILDPTSYNAAALSAVRCGSFLVTVREDEGLSVQILCINRCLDSGFESILDSA